MLLHPLFCNYEKRSLPSQVVQTDVTNNVEQSFPQPEHLTNRLHLFYNAKKYMKMFLF
jgi:hypothetical protein